MSESSPPPLSRSAEGPGLLPTWVPFEALGGLIAAALAYSLATLVLVVPFTGSDGADLIVGSQLVLAVTLVSVAVGFAGAYGPKHDRLRTLGFRRPKGGWIGLTALTYLGFVGFAVLLSALGGDQQQEDLTEDLGVDDSIGLTIAAALLVVIAAPIGEEVFFRGFFFSALRRRSPFWLAALVSGGLFGAVHLSTSNVTASVQLAVLGVLLAWLLERTGSIVPCIALHAANNGVAFTLLLTV